MDRKKIVARVTLVVMGLFAYLILAITGYQKAMAAPVGEDVPHDSVGWAYAMYQPEATRSYSVYAISTSIKTSLGQRAMNECAIDGDTDFSCYLTRYQMFLDYMVSTTERATGKTTNGALVKFFWLWVKEMEVDEYTPMHSVVNIFCGTVVKAYEGTKS